MLAEIDGSILEGGGQILRVAAALSAISSTAVSINRIRANRFKPGLRPQHQAGLQLVAEICSGTLTDAVVGSSAITLTPETPQAGNFKADPGTAGSCSLLAQAALPVMLFARGKESQDVNVNCSSLLDLHGGTDAAMAPPVSYLQKVLLPTLRRLYDINIEDQLERRGFFPKGAGHLRLRVAPLQSGKALRAIDLTERGDVLDFYIHAFTAGKLQPKLATRMAAAACHTLKMAGYTQSVSEELAHHTKSTEVKAVGDGTGILIIARTASGCLLGGSALGEKGVLAEDVGATAARQVLEDLASGGCVDRWLQDQLIIFMALAQGTSSLTCGQPELHTRTAAAVCEKLIGAKFEFQRPESSSNVYRIICRGAGVSCK